MNIEMNSILSMTQVMLQPTASSCRSSKLREENMKCCAGKAGAGCPQIDQPKAADLPQ